MPNTPNLLAGVGDVAAVSVVELARTIMVYFTKKKLGREQETVPSADCFRLCLICTTSRTKNLQPRGPPGLGRVEPRPGWMSRAGLPECDRLHSRSSVVWLGAVSCAFSKIFFPIFTTCCAGLKVPMPRIIFHLSLT